MAASPPWKVFNPSGEYVASCKHAEDAAAIVAAYGDGAKISYRRDFTAWHEGKEEGAASESYDIVRRVCHRRLAIWRHGMSRCASTI